MELSSCNGHVDLRAESGESLVDGVVDDLIDQMVKTTRTSGANVHARTFADRFQALEHLDIRTIVMAGSFSVPRAYSFSGSVDGLGVDEKLPAPREQTRCDCRRNPFPAIYKFYHKPLFHRFIKQRV